MSTLTMLLLAPVVIMLWSLAFAGVWLIWHSEIGDSIKSFFGKKDTI